MNGLRKRKSADPGFLREAAAGFVISLIGAIVLAGLQWVIEPITALRAVVATVGGIALVRVLSRRRTGRVVLFVIWAGSAAVCWLAPLTLPAYVTAHAGLLWLLKSIHTRAPFLETAANAGVTLLALATAVWAGSQAHSAFLAFWCFFLVSALNALIQEPLAALTGSKHAPAQPLDKFDAAHRAANAAFSELTSTR